jgi:hypothetical protein
MKFTRFEKLILGLISSILCLAFVVVGGIVYFTLTNNSITTSNQVSTPKIERGVGEFPESIPGMTFNKLAKHLGDVLITCGSMQKDAVSYSASCNGVLPGDTEIGVQVFSGNKPDDIYLILSYVYQPLADINSDEMAAKTLGYIATLPYTNSDPKKAFLWVQDHISDLTPNSPISSEPIVYIGGVRFHMSCHDKTMRCLAIGNPSD